MNQTKLHEKLQILISVPWCCVSSIVLIAISLVSSVVPLAGIGIVDDFFHTWLLVPAMALHVYGIYRYMRYDHHKTTRKNVLYIGLSLLFVVSLWFHFSDVHDMLFHHIDA